MNTRAATRIKICGITRMADAMAVAETGADALGFVFTDLSARQVDPAVAGPIAVEMAGRLCRVGLFVDQPADQVRRVLDQVELDVLQFNGAESAEFCRGFGVPYMRAHRVREAVDARTLDAAFPDAGWQLLDAYVAGQAGGTGQRFDWQFWPKDSSGAGDGRDLKFVLAGGLNPDNVAEAIVALRPYGVDVSGGVESARKGEKDAGKIRAFVAAVRRADAAPGAVDRADSSFKHKR